MHRDPHGHTCTQPARNGPQEEKTPAILVTIEEAADLLKIGRSTMYKLSGGTNPEIPKVKIGTCTRIAVDDIKAYVDRQRRAAA